MPLVFLIKITRWDWLFDSRSIAYHLTILVLNAEQSQAWPPAVVPRMCRGRRNRPYLSASFLLQLIIWWKAHQCGFPCLQKVASWSCICFLDRRNKWWPDHSELLQGKHQDSRRQEYKVTKHAYQVVEWIIKFSTRINVLVNLPGSYNGPKLRVLEQTFQWDLQEVA